MSAFWGSPCGGIWDLSGHVFGAAAKKRIAELEAQVRELRELVAELQEELRKNSGNSSQPPSSDKPWSKPEGKTAGADKPVASKGKAGGKPGKRGGQPGHPGVQSALLLADQVDSIDNRFPGSCEGCGDGLPRREGDVDPRRHQVAHLPEMKPKIREHRCHGVACDACGHVTYAILPVTVPASGFCARLTGLVALCTGDLRMSKRSAQRFLGTVFKLTVSLGAISKMERRVSDALAWPADEARQYVTRQKALHQDESGWKEGHKEMHALVAFYVQQHARDYELKTASSEALIRVAMIRNMACRLARSV